MGGLKILIFKMSGLQIQTTLRIVCDCLRELWLCASNLELHIPLLSCRCFADDNFDSQNHHLCRFLESFYLHYNNR